MNLIAYELTKLQTLKDVVREMSKKSRLRRPFEKHYGKRAQTLLKSARHYLYYNYWSLWNKFSWKKSLLVICKILELSVNTLPADDKYSLLNKDNLTQPIQMQLSEKEKTFFNLFSGLMKFRLNFENFQKNKNLRADELTKLRTRKDIVRQISKMSRFRKAYNKQHGKWSQTLLKFAQQHLYNIYW